MPRTPLLFINSESVQAFFLRIFLVNSPDLLNKQEIVFKKDKATLHVISKNVKTQ